MVSQTIFLSVSRCLPPPAVVVAAAAALCKRRSHTHSRIRRTAARKPLFVIPSSGFKGKASPPLESPLLRSSAAHRRHRHHRASSSAAAATAGGRSSPIVFLFCSSAQDARESVLMQSKSLCRCFSRQACVRVCRRHGSAREERESEQASDPTRERERTDVCKR